MGDMGLIQDTQIMEIIAHESRRQNDHIELIASENFVSKSVLAAQGSILTNKYAEGYPGNRYYQGCQFVDQIEDIAIQRLKKLFGADYANVQPHSGSQANQAALLALLNPGDTILSMSLNDGGHLSHGHKVSLAGKWFKIVSYGVKPDNYLIDYEAVEALAQQHRPKVIIAGCSSYPRSVDFSIFSRIAKSVDAYLLADMAHIAGIVAAGYHQNPVYYADVVTSTTHKTLRGPRGGIILTNSETLAKKINSAVFPGIQGGPLMHVIAAKAVAFLEALQPSFKNYIEHVLENARVLADEIQKRGYEVLTKGTDTHLIMIKLEHLNGLEASNLLESVGIVCNKNSIPFDSRPPSMASGIRIGSPACTTRGMKALEFSKIAHLICDVLDLGVQAHPSSLDGIRSSVQDLCKQFPLPY
jgi:glycine hydroxymethyltransferase